jgi:hypothetical protein
MPVEVWQTMVQVVKKFTNEGGGVGCCINLQFPVRVLFKKSGDYILPSLRFVNDLLSH